MFPLKEIAIKTCIVVFALATLASCGYQLVREKGIYGGDIASLSVPIFKNITYEPHASLYVTEAFTRELVTTGLFKINKEDSDGYLTGVIKSIKITPSSMDKTGVVVEKNVAIDVDISLYRKNGGFIKKWNFSEFEIYRVDDLAFEDFNKREAISRLSRRMARKFSSVMMIDY